MRHILFIMGLFLAFSAFGQKGKPNLPGKPGKPPTARPTVPVPVPSTRPVPPTAPPGNQPTQNGSDFINILFSDEFSFKLVGIDTLKKLNGNVELNQDDIYLFCDSAIIINSIRVAAKGNFILQHGDSTTIFSDSALYRADTKIAELFVNVSLVRGNQKLFTDQLIYDANTKIARYTTGATLTDDSTYLTSVKGYYHTATDEIFFREKVVVESPDFTLRTDTLKFLADAKTVVFVAPTLILQDTAKIYTESGFYNIPNKIAVFNKNPQYLKNDQKAWAKQMEYDGNKEEITLIGDAHFEDSTTNATADRIIYNEKTGVTILMGHAHIVDDKRNITGDTVTYDSKKGTYATRGRSHIVDGAQILDANRVDYDKEREIGIAQGNVILQDTSERLTVICEFAEHSKQKNYFKASGGKTGRPLLIKEIDKDSIYISADTLLSFEPVDTLNKAKTDSLALTTVDTTAKNLPQTPDIAKDQGSAPTPKPEPKAKNTKPKESSIPQKLFNIPFKRDSLSTTPTPPLATDTLGIDSLADASQAPTSKPPPPKEKRSILAYHDVRIFKKDLQALCDSLAYSSLDSMFRLYRAPIIWSDTSQFTADTVMIQLANDKIDRIFLRQNSFIVNTPDEFFFNQIKGKHSIAMFDSSELRRVRVEGNAESVYYALDDDKAYIGVNKTICSEMLILFGNNQVEGIKFYTQPKATLFPMNKADHEGLKMAGYSWQIERRPKGIDDLLKAKTTVISVPSTPPPAKVDETPPVQEKE